MAGRSGRAFAPFRTDVSLPFVVSIAPNNCMIDPSLPALCGLNFSIGFSRVEEISNYSLSSPFCVSDLASFVFLKPDCLRIDLLNHYADCVCLEHEYSSSFERRVCRL